MDINNIFNLIIGICLILIAVGLIRKEFVTNDLTTHIAKPRRFNRGTIYEDVIGTYDDDLCEVLSEYPFKVVFQGEEQAVDTGGVCRDMFSCFWEAAYLKHFDGERLLVPIARPGERKDSLSTLGAIISHGFLVCGVLPARVAFPVLASVLCGPNITIPDNINLESFIDYITAHESSLLRRGLSEAQAGNDFSNDLKSKLVSLVSRFDCMDVPTKKNIHRLIRNVARHHFLGKTLGMIYTMHSGVPKTHGPFWKKLSVEKLFDLYKVMNGTALSVLQLIEEPEFDNQAESKVFNFLTTFIGNCKPNELRSFLRFVTGSAVIIDKAITIEFNSISGLARRPISHTCSCMLELSTSYGSYLEFEKEFLNILSTETAFVMDSV